MKTKQPRPWMQNLIESLGDCLTPESAKRILKIRADAKLQARINVLARLNGEGNISESEREELRDYVSFGTYVSILQSRARLLLAIEQAKS